MRSLPFLKIISVSLLAALLFALVSIVAIRYSFEVEARDRRAGMLEFVGESIERRVEGLSAEEIRRALSDDLLGPGPGSPGPEGMGPGPEGPGPEGPGGLRPGGPPNFGGAPPPPPGGPLSFDRPPPRPENFERLRQPPGRSSRYGRLPHPHGLEAWLFNSEGEVVASRSARKSAAPLKPQFPEHLHEITARSQILSQTPAVSMIRLDHEPPLYLLVQEPSRPFWTPLVWTQALLSFGTLACSLALALSVIFLYLQRKSREAKAVLARLEHGDLGSRFPIRRFDEFSGLLLDFNRMADEIERLVGRIRKTEDSRRELLRELGHDLRTPLASLRTCFETLRDHAPQMTDTEKAETFAMGSAELRYFGELLENLMTIASLDELHYRQSLEAIDIGDLLANEIRSRNSVAKGTSSDAPVEWKLSTNSENLASDFVVLGDLSLLRRLFRNGFDNASRFAKRWIDVEVGIEANELFVKVRDDGPGLDATALESFGKRQERRRPRADAPLMFSLGLGSVIMKSVADLHGGRIEIRNREVGTGAELTIWLPVR